MAPLWEETAEQLTQQAVRAAESGRWDTVDRCYQRRAELFRVHDVSSALAGRLHPLDAHVHARLRTATMAVQHVLTEVSWKRRRVECFGEELTASSDRSRRVSRRV
jgi:hypothetical protein